MRSQYLIILFVINFITFAVNADEDLFIKELVQGVSKFTRSNLIFPEKCGQTDPAKKTIAMNNHPTCQIRLNELSQAIEPISNQSAIQKLIESKKPQLVVIGETHGSPTSLRYPEILYSLKKLMPQLDCLFIEQPESYNSNIQQLIKNGSLPFDSKTNTDLMVSQNEILSAHKLGIKIIPIDNHPLRSNIHTALSEEGMKQRNIVMTQELNQKLKDGTCRSGVLITGAHHWTKGGPSNEIDSLKDLIKVPTASMILINTSCHPTLSPNYTDPIWSWSVCKSNPPKIKVESQLNTKLISSSIPLTPDGGKWNDFDIGIITAPTYDENCRRITEL